MTMMFAGLTSGYLVRRGEGNWLLFQLPEVFFVSTVVILFSSITMFLSLKNTKKEKNKKAIYYLLLTFFFGVFFVALQVQGWGQLLEQKVFFTGEKSNAAGSFIYVLTFLHLIHLFAALISVIVSIFAMSKQKYTKSKMLGLELTSTFWHFITALWLYLFLFLLFIR